MDWIKTLDPLKQGVKQDEIDVAVQKLSLLRALGPKAITGDIANLMSQVINASGGNVRRSIILTFPLLVDKLLEFVDHWAVKVSSAIASPAKEDIQPKANNVVGSFQIVQSEWQNYDDVERERMIPILQTELKTLRELYQERVDEINNFETRMAERQIQAQEETAMLQRKLHLIQEEYESFKQSSRLQPEQSSDASPPEEAAELVEQREAYHQLQQDVQGLHAEIKHLLKEKDMLVQSSTQLEEELHGTIMAKEKLTQQVAEYRRQVEQIPQLEAMLTMSNQQKMQAEAQLKKSETALKNQEKIVETLAKNLQKKEKEYQKLIQQLDGTQAQMRKTEESLNLLSNEHVALETKMQGLHCSIEELQECKEILTKSQEELQRKVFALETDLVKSRVDNQNLQDDLQTVTNEKDMLLIALETSSIKLREKIEELEAIEAQKKTSATPATIQHIQQGIVGGVGNIVDYFEHRSASGGSVSPVPGSYPSSGHNGAGSGTNTANTSGTAAKPAAFPLLKRLSTGITSFAQGQQPAHPSEEVWDSSGSGGGGSSSSSNNMHGGVDGGVKSHALAASIRSKYSSGHQSQAANHSTTLVDANSEWEDDPSYYAPVPSTRDVDSDDEA